MVCENSSLLILALVVHFPVKSLCWKHGGLAASLGLCGLADLGRNVVRGARPGSPGPYMREGGPSGEQRPEGSTQSCSSSLPTSSFPSFLPSFPVGVSEASCQALCSGPINQSSFVTLTLCFCVELHDKKNSVWTLNTGSCVSPEALPRSQQELISVSPRFLAGLSRALVAGEAEWVFVSLSVPVTNWLLSSSSLRNTEAVL